MLTPYGHLTYCTNIHPGENWPDHFAALKENFPAIKRQLSPGRPMGIGLRLSNEASITLHEQENLNAFMEWLQAEQAYVFTMNGFPYGGFHHTRVKEQVHTPDWTTTERFEYSVRLFEILASLLPADLNGGVSTSPLSYRHWFQSEEELRNAKRAATRNVVLVAEHLVQINREKGRLLHLDIEPEPDGMMETIQEFIEWYEQDLLPAGIPYISSRFGTTNTEAEALIKAHVRLCYDVCHVAIGYESHAGIVQQLNQRGIRTGKIQISAALKSRMPEDDEERSSIINAFRKFDEPVYLHQVVAHTKDGDHIKYPDLPDALLDARNPMVTEWRAHFHVPVFQQDFDILKSTQQDIREVLAIHKNFPFTNHLEVETYTWEVLPAELKTSMQSSIVRELQWVAGELPGS